MKIRKQVYDLTLQDIEQHPVWEFALDEEGEEGQAEAMVHPYAIEGRNRDELKKNYKMLDRDPETVFPCSAFSNSAYRYPSSPIPAEKRIGAVTSF